MASKLLRRSGVAVGLIAELLEWRADVIFQVGIGMNHEEMTVLTEEWEGVEIIGCEPHPKILKGLGDYPGRVLACAMGETEGEAILYSKSRHKDGSSLYPMYVTEKDVEYDEIRVAVSTLDVTFLPLVDVKRNRVLLWLDCEGSELDVLRGGTELLKDVDVVNVEITANPPSSEWCSPKSVHDFLVSHGFLRQWIHTQRTHQGQYDATYVIKGLFREKYCCDPF